MQTVKQNLENVRRFKCACGCGQYVRPNFVREQIPSKHLKGVMIDKGKILKISGYGYMDNGYFNTMTCGFRWAVRKISSGK